MIPNKSYYNTQSMNNMISNAKRQALEMNEKSTNTPKDIQKEQQRINQAEKTNTPEKVSKAVNKKPSNSSIFGDLLGNFNLSFNFDEDTILLAGLLYILYKHNADKNLLIALIYVLLF